MKKDSLKPKSKSAIKSKVSSSGKKRIARNESYITDLEEDELGIEFTNHYGRNPIVWVYQGAKEGFPARLADRWSPNRNTKKCYVFVWQLDGKLNAAWAAIYGKKHDLAIIQPLEKKGNFVQKMEGSTAGFVDRGIDNVKIIGIEVRQKKKVWFFGLKYDHGGVYWVSFDPFSEPKEWAHDVTPPPRRK